MRAKMFPSVHTNDLVDQLYVRLLLWCHRDINNTCRSHPNNLLLQRREYCRADKSIWWHSRWIFVGIAATLKTREEEHIDWRINHILAWDLFMTSQLFPIPDDVRRWTELNISQNASENLHAFSLSRMVFFYRSLMKSLRCFGRNWIRGIKAKECAQ